MTLETFQLMKKGWWLRVHYWNDQKKQIKRWSLWINDQLISEKKEDIEKRLSEEHLPPLPYVGEPKRLMNVLAFVDGHQMTLGEGAVLNAICCNAPLQKKKFKMIQILQLLHYHQ